MVRSGTLVEIHPETMLGTHASVSPLAIGRQTLRLPLFQGGMGVRISARRLAGAVARSGGLGIVATAALGFRSGGKGRIEAAGEKETRAEVEEAVALAKGGVVGVNCMVALREFDRVVPAACDAGARVIVSGAGLPFSLPALVAGHPEVALVPIVSSLRAAELIARRWERRHGRLPDAIVVEDPDTAGGHLGDRAENIGVGGRDHYGTVRAIKEMFLRDWQVRVPVIAAGGVWGREEFLHALEQGADGVQMATRFVVTEECDADRRFKEAYLTARPEDIGLIRSPVGMPGRALRANVERIAAADRDRKFTCPASCLEECSYRDAGEGFCLVEALSRAQAGDVETGLVFCGTNAWRAERIGTVREVFEEIFGVEAAAAAAF